MEQHSRPKEFDDAVISLRRSLLAFAMSLVGRRDRAEDLVQDTLVKALAKCAQFEPDSNLKAWLFTILRNELYSKLRKGGREVQDSDGVLAALVPINAAQPWAYDLKVVRKRMRMLPPGWRQAAELVAVLGEEYEVAAEMLGVPVGTIKSRVHRARHFLETGEELAEEAVAVEEVGENKAADRIERLYRSGLSIGEIKAAVSGASRSEIMQVILERKLPARCA